LQFSAQFSAFVGCVLGHSLLDMDTVSKKKRSEIMSRVKSRDSKIEVAFRKELWQRGFRYLKNSSRYFGKPDMVLPKYKTVVFIDSCFWHGCKKHCRIPSSRTEYWSRKIERNRKRDETVNKYYREIKWQTIRIWEHDLKSKDFVFDFEMIKRNRSAFGFRWSAIYNVITSGVNMLRRYV